MSKSREQRLITMEHIATHTNLIPCLNQLYIPVLIDKTFKSSIAKILTVTLSASLLL